ncbi:MAG TPA: hypothetical protein VN830_00710 [Verrucomicrobiae bacterium]|nr:hypothetical protein [Verrucomicrobiae bacterium]
MHCETATERKEWSYEGWEDLVQEALAEWEECPVRLPPFPETFTVAEQAAREARLEEFIKSVEGDLRRPPRSKSGRKVLRERVTVAFERFAKAGLDLGDEHLGLLLNGGFSELGTQMARGARRFDPSISPADIFQATRNAWTAGGLQVLLGREMRLTPAIFAYSMLYPYTDNYLDDTAVRSEEKIKFNARIKRRLSGEMIAPNHEGEARLWQLFEMIEGQYRRADWPQVYASLLAIQQAQENSLRQRGSPPSVCGPDILKLSFEKGGASVLADGHLAAGSLSHEEAQFVFAWGALLQLVDDLQDIRQDRREGALTIFTQAAGRVPLDELTTHTLSFGQKVMQRIEQMPTRCQALKEMIQKSYMSLLVWSAGECGELYTREYLAELETHSPFRFASVAARRKQVAKLTGPLTRLFEAFVEDEKDEAKVLSIQL